MEILKSYRARIDEIDDKIVDLMVARTNIVREVGELKFRKNIPAVLPDRVNEVINRTAARAEDKDLDPALVRKIYTLLVDYSCILEKEIMTALAATKEAVGK